MKRAFTKSKDLKRHRLYSGFTILHFNSQEYLFSQDAERNSIIQSKCYQLTNGCLSLSTLSMWKINYVPNSGICREVIGIFSEMLSWNTVRDSKTVTPIT